MFEEGKIYKHLYPLATYNIKIIDVLEKTDEHYVLNIWYITRSGGNIHSIDTVRILTSDLSDWSEL